MFGTSSLRRACLAASILLLFSSPVFAIEYGRWKMDLDASSLETMLLDPESVLADPEAFWASDPAYRLSMSWHKNNHVPLDSRGWDQKWRAALEERAAMDPEARRTDVAFELLGQVRERLPRFEQEALPLLDRFLPENDLKFETGIYFTTGTYSFAFMTSTRIVADPISPYFRNDPDMLMNTMTHECYHIGYGINRSRRTECELEDPFVYHTMMDGLQNEGLATYVGYTAMSIFPAPAVPDHRKLDEPETVRAAFAALNELFALVGRVSADSLRAAAWKTGVEDRAYYVAGAHMGRTIDRVLGREALLETISTGPLGFVAVYNGIAEDGLKVREFTKPAYAAAIEAAKAAAFAGDEAGFETAAATLLATAAERSQAGRDLVRRQLERTGYGVLHQDKTPWAIRVFELDVALNPDEPNPLDCLAEAHLKAGDRDAAIRYYEKALEVDPQWKNAQKMLAELNGSTGS